MAATFDGENLIITLEAPTDGILNVDAETDLYSDWKEWFKTSDNAKYPLAFRTIGGDPLTPGIDAGAYFFIRNDLGWRIRPSEADHTVYLTGNLAPEDSSLPIMIPTIGAHTVLVDGLQPITQNIDTIKDSLEFALFSGGVWFDSTSPYSGTGNLVGTGRAPVNNWDDALTIATDNGLDTFYVFGDATLNNSNDFTNYTFIGQGENLSVFTLEANATFVNCTFEDATVTGTLDGESRINYCIIDDLNFVSGIITNCVLTQNTITLGGNATAEFVNCVSGVPGTNTPTIDCGGSGQALALRNYSGGIKLTNKTGTEDVSIDLSSGQVKLDPNVTTGVTNGTIVCRGDGKVINADTDALLPFGISTFNGATILNETNNLYANLSQQDVRDAMTLANVDTPVDDSVDKKLQQAIDAAIIF